MPRLPDREYNGGVDRRVVDGGEWSQDGEMTQTLYGSIRSSRTLARRSAASERLSHRARIVDRISLNITEVWCRVFCAATRLGSSRRVSKA